jgi:hypothetical protein
MKSTIFQDITLCSLLKVNRHFRRTCRPHLNGRRIRGARNQNGRRWQAEPCSAYSSTLKMEAICFSETSVDFQRTTWHYIPEDSTLDQRIICFYGTQTFITMIAKSEMSNTGRHLRQYGQYSD